MAQLIIAFHSYVNATTNELQCWVIQLDGIVKCSGPISLFLVNTAFQIIQ